MKSMKDIFRSYAVFDSEGRHTNGTDKESNHSYGDAYENLFIDPADREDVRLMMEIGVADGSSLLAWRDIFPNATIVGMDIHAAAKVDANLTSRIEFYLGNQRSLADCRKAAAGRQFDLIVEDALHELDATLMTLLYLWPHVAPGGMYVVEEFPNIGELQDNVKALWRDNGCGECNRVEVINTTGPFGGIEPLVVFRKPTR